MEDLLREFCATQVINYKYINDAQFYFKHSMALTRAFDKSGINDWIWKGLKDINSLRNDLAHQLTPVKFLIKRDNFVDYILASSKADTKNILNKFDLNFQKLAASIYILYSTLSQTLKYKTKREYLAEALLHYQPDNKSN